MLGGLLLHDCRVFRGSISMFWDLISQKYAGVAQLVERQPSKLNVGSSSLLARSSTALWGLSPRGRFSFEWFFGLISIEGNAALF